ncbi:MAG: hypothetical protein WA061_00915 [Microgenomates group bacterium]
MFSYFKTRKKVLFIAVLFFLIQLPFLDQLSLLRGERDILLTGWSLAHTARDLYGKLLPLEFTGIDPNVPFVPMYVTALWWLFVPVKSVFLSRLFFVLLSTSVPFLIYEIINFIKKDEKIALITATIFCFSPGIFYLSRLALEIGVAFPLLLAGILCYLKEKKIPSFVFFFLSFFSYHGFRPLIPFLLIYLELFFNIKGEKKRMIPNIGLILFFSITLLLLSLKIDGNLMKSRSSDLIFMNFTQLANQIDYRRNTSIAPKAVAALFDNKITALGMYIKDNFFGGISLEYLFRNGDPSSLYATTFSGQFFLTFIILFILGFVQLGKHGKRHDVYILGLILVGLIPSLANVSYPSYSIRAMLSTVGFSYLFAMGYVYLEFLFGLISNKKKLIKYAFISIIGVSLFAELGYFGYNFYFRRVRTMSQMYFETERMLPNYLNSSDKPYTIYTSSPRDMFFGYIFFNSTVKANVVQEVMKKGEPYLHENYAFEKCTQSMVKTKVIISDICLDEIQYAKMSGSQVKKMGYTDYSFRNAFFIVD